MFLMRKAPTLRFNDKFLEVSEMSRVVPETYFSFTNRLEEYLRRCMAMFLRDSLCVSAQRNVFEGSTLASSCSSAIALLECYVMGSHDQLVSSLCFTIAQHTQRPAVVLDVAGESECLYSIIIFMVMIKQKNILYYVLFDM